MRVTSRSRAFVVGLALVISSLTGCSGSVQPDPDIEVSGLVGQAPTVTYVTPLSVTDTYRDTIWPGDGPVLVEGGPVLFDFWLEDATDATVVSQTYDSKPETRQLTPEALGADLYETLRGAHVGARLVQVSPAVASGVAGFASVTVIDVLPLRANGEAVELRSDLPAVTLSDSGAPSVAASESNPPSILIAQPLIRGAGAQVGPQDTVTFQFAGFSWVTGEVFDSSWSRGQPESWSLLDLPDAFSEGLVDQTVGSQIELVVPPSYALKIAQSQEMSGQTVVYVVDILSTRSPGE